MADVLDPFAVAEDDVKPVQIDDGEAKAAEAPCVDRACGGQRIDRSRVLKQAWDDDATALATEIMGIDAIFDPELATNATFRRATSR